MMAGGRAARCARSEIRAHRISGCARIAMDSPQFITSGLRPVSSLYSWISGLRSDVCGILQPSAAKAHRIVPDGVPFSHVAAAWELGPARASSEKIGKHASWPFVQRPKRPSRVLATTSNDCGRVRAQYVVPGAVPAAFRLPSGVTHAARSGATARSSFDVQLTKSNLIAILQPASPCVAPAGRDRTPAAGRKSRKPHCEHLDARRKLRRRFAARNAAQRRRTQRVVRGPPTIRRVRRSASPKSFEAAAAAGHPFTPRRARLPGASRAHVIITRAHQARALIPPPRAHAVQRSGRALPSRRDAPAAFGARCH